MTKFWGSVSEPGFWEMFGDSEYKQRRDIDIAFAHEDELANDLDGLAKQVGQLQRTVLEIQVMNTVLMRLLAEANAVDLTVLRYRVEAELDAIDEAKRPPPGTSACSRCKRIVPTGLLAMLPTGLVCDRCSA